MAQANFDSTLVRSANSAVTFTDMVEFAEILETRPLSKLVAELPELARLSSTKFAIASNVLRRRFRGESPADQLQLRVVADEIAGTAADRDLAQRIRALFSFEQA